MRNTPFAAVATVAMLAACQPAAQPLSSADETAIQAVMTSYTDAASSNNVEGMTAVYASDAIVHPNGMAAAAGTAAIHKLWTDMAGMMRLKTFAFSSTKVAGQGDVAYVTGSYHLTATLADSAATALPPEDGKFVSVLRRQSDKSWKIVADSWNTNTMPEAPAALAPPARPH